MIFYLNTSSIVAMVIFVQSIYEADHKDQQLTGIMQHYQVKMHDKVFTKCYIIIYFSGGNQSFIWHNELVVWFQNY